MSTTPPTHSKALDVLDRLPPGVEYTFVKMIVLGAPGPLTTSSWIAAPGEQRSPADRVQVKQGDAGEAGVSDDRHGERPRGQADTENLWRAFRTKTYRVIDRRLCKAEAALGPAALDEQRMQVRAFRHQF